MYVSYTDYGITKSKKVQEFSLVGNYIFVDKDYLLSETGGRVHISQLIEVSDKTPTGK